MLKKIGLRQVPKHQVFKLKEKNSDYCVCIPVVNEGERIKKQLAKIKKQKINEKVDIFILDGNGGSTDDSTDQKYLKKMGVTKLLVIQKSQGELSSQLRMGYARALEDGYKGIITIDGNNKDNVSAIPSFIKKLKQGYHLVQGSRSMKGGKAINTPILRHLANKFIHIPIISFLAGFKYTDTTNGYRAYSRELLLDKRVQPFREMFTTYELLAFLNIRAPQLDYKTIEVPVIRAYPKGKVPTKISALRGNFLILKILLNCILGKYNPKI